MSIIRPVHHCGALSSLYPALAFEACAAYPSDLSGVELVGLNTFGQRDRIDVLNALPSLRDGFWCRATCLVPIEQQERRPEAAFDMPEHTAE